MNDALLIPPVLVRHDVSYLPLPNRVELVLTNVRPPEELTSTSFVLGVLGDAVVLANHARRGLEMSGGHVEPGETPELAARREGGEETGAQYATMWSIGYLRCISEGTVPPNHPYPHPVGYQALHAALITSIETREDYLECRRPAMLTPDAFGQLADHFAEELRLVHAAALEAVGRNDTIEELAAKARPIDEDDWASERQIDAENRFFDECRRLHPDIFEEGGDFDDFCLKATTDEQIDEALSLIPRT